MAVYTVHEPPQRGGAAAADVERFAFVRDGFSWWAFLFAPLWMLRHRMWLVLVGYVVIAVGLQILIRAFGGSAGLAALVGLLIGLLAGLEAGTLRRFTLSRRGWKNLGVVSGDDREDAERRFFDAWVTRPNASAGIPQTPPPPMSAPAVPSQRRPQGPDVIGLFPEPGAPR
jgi:Protein of unknown function (DUF2628)